MRLRARRASRPRGARGDAPALGAGIDGRDHAHARGPRHRDVGAPRARLDYARKMGATATLGLDLPPAERLESIRGLTANRGVDIVIEASGAPDAVSQGLDMVRDGGRMIVCGHYTDNVIAYSR